MHGCQTNKEAICGLTNGIKAMPEKEIPPPLWGGDLYYVEKHQNCIIKYSLKYEQKVSF